MLVFALSGLPGCLSQVLDASISTGALNVADKFSGAAVVGTKVVFVPHNADVVGLFDTSDSSFSTVSTGDLTRDDKFEGATAVGTKAIFAPFHADVVGIFDTSDSSFSTVSTGDLTMDW